MLNIEDEDNPLAALIKKADQEGQNNNNDDPIIVFNEDDAQDNGPITLSLRQPSFSHLTCGNLVPKGGNESISKSNEKFISKMNDPLSKKHSSSYADIKITIDQSMKNDIQEIKNQNKESRIDNSSNPILVLTGNNDIEDEENDESNVPIGLSVRQPSFASLCNHIIPKGGLESGDIPIVIEEEPKNISNPKETKTNTNISANSSNPVIVLTGNDEKADNEDDESAEPIGLSVRQPSFVSLCNHIIPKGGTETGDMPIVIEEECIGNTQNEPNDIDNEIEPMVLNVRQSSYANLHLGTQPPPTTTPDIEPIPDEEIEATANTKENKKSDIDDSNKPSKSQEDTIIVLTADDKEEDDDNVPIGLSVRQPSFASLTGNIVPKGGFQSTVPTITEEAENCVLDQEISDVDINSSSSDAEKENEIEQNNTNDENKNNETGNTKNPEMKDKILSSLLSINKEWWKEIGYKPPDNLHSIFKRNCSMFNVPTTKNFMKSAYGSSSSNDTTDSSSKSNIQAIGAIKRPSQSLYQGQLNKLDDLLKDGDSTKTSSRRKGMTKATRGPSIYRVNSYGNKTELMEVEVPLKKEEDQNGIPFTVSDDSEKSKNQEESNTEENPESKNQSEIESRTKSKQGALSSSSISATTSNKSVEKPIKMSRGPSMQRVSSFGNASTLKVVEMPTISEDKIESQNQNQSTNEDFIREYEEEEECNHDIPPEILKMMSKPRDPIVYSALCGASINGYKRETVHRALGDLKSMYKKCQDKDMEVESEFLNRVIDSVRIDAAADDPYFEVEEQMRDTEIELQSKLSDWQNMYEELDEEYKVQVEECEQRYQDDLMSLEEEFHTTKTTEKTVKTTKKPPKPQQKKDDKDDENDDESSMKTLTEDNGLTVIDDTNPLYDKKRPNQTANYQTGKKRHSSLTPKRLTILSPSLSGTKTQKPQQRSKATVYSSTAPRKTPILQPSASPSVSPDAAKMKQKVLKMIKAQRFEESFELSLKYYKKQMIEHQKQVNKRSQAFLAAKSALKQKHEDERKEIDLNFQAKRDEFTKKREQSLVPLREQIIQLKKMKSLIEEGEKNEKFNETMQPRLRASRTRKGRVVTQSLPPLSRNSNA